MTQDKTAKLSIVVLAYNEEDYIGTVLSSIAAQTTPPDEVIVVDNNSTDATAKIASSFSFVRVVSETEQGIIPARDRGFNEAAGPLVARIDADTKLPHDWVATVHAICDAHANDIYGVSGPAFIYDTSSKLVGKVASHVAVNQGFFRGSKLMLGHDTLYGSNMVITKKAWLKVQNETCRNSRELHEDVDLSIHIAKYGVIEFDDRLKAGVSKRAFFYESPKKTWWRLRIWPQTVTKHRRLFMKNAASHKSH